MKNQLRLSVKELGESFNIFHQQNKMIEIPDYGEIGAGTVVPFPSEVEEEDETKIKKIKIAQPSNAHDGDVLFSHSVNGDSLNDFDDPMKNICNGDALICKQNITISEVTPDKICIVFISRTCERLAKKVIHDEEKGIVYLRSTNPKYADRRFLSEEVEIKGIVIGFKRFI